eukprot:TRINITY_DN4930_c0_g1_i1.p1 TRINITY_DN4930_c0_g1~~TRINITY_DN4930_c0_g1_i1.p1  ORF type:complete len:418 (+),score=104.33 TRINITY_DN4930_c0_g1_i1:79-1332(+)
MQLVVRWLYFFGFVLYCCGAALALPWQANTKKRPVPVFRLIRNTLSLLCCAIAVVLPLFFKFSGGYPRSYHPEGWANAETWLSVIHLEGLELRDTFWMRFGVFFYETLTIVWFYNVLDFLNDFQGYPMYHWSVGRRIWHILCLPDSRDVIPRSQAAPFNWWELVKNVCIFFPVTTFIGYHYEYIIPGWEKLDDRSALLFFLVSFECAVWFVYSYISMSYCIGDLAMRMFGYSLPPNLQASPLTAHSLAEFWIRWNRVVGGSLEVHFFNPIVGRDTSVDGSNKKHDDPPTKVVSPKPTPQPRAPRARTAFAVFVTFMASGLFHSWPVLAASRDIRLAMMAQSYFVVQAFLSVVEKIFLSQWLKKQHSFLFYFVYVQMLIVIPMPLLAQPVLSQFDGFCLTRCKAWSCCATDFTHFLGF